MFDKTHKLFSKIEKQDKEDITFVEYETPSYLIPDIYCTVSLMDENRKEILGVFDEDRKQMGFKKYDWCRQLKSNTEVEFTIKKHYNLPVIVKYALVRNKELDISMAVAFKEPFRIDSSATLFSISVKY